VGASKECQKIKLTTIKATASSTNLSEVGYARKLNPRKIGAIKMTGIASFQSSGRRRLFPGK